MAQKYNYGKRSVESLDTCHKDLQLIAYEAIKVSDVDFGISEGHRALERQKKLYDEKKSRIDGISQKGKHNYIPSLAFDVYAYVNGKASWEVKDLTYIGGVMTSTAHRLYDEGKITHILRWGANWDNDGVIMDDQTFQDLPHFELLKP